MAAWKLLSQTTSQRGAPWSGQAALWRLEGSPEPTTRPASGLETPHALGIPALQSKENPETRPRRGPSGIPFLSK